MKKILISFAAIFLSMALQAQTQGELTVNVTTSNAGGQYAPRHIVAVWVEDDSGNFVKTLMAYANVQIQYLLAWQTSTSASGDTYNTTDAITGATLTQHATRICSWDGTDVSGNITSDGTYKVCFELTDKNQAGNYAEYSFTKGNTAESITPADAPSFNSLSIDWSPNTSICLTDKPSKLGLFPNPAHKNIRLNMDNLTPGNIQVIVYNTLGSMVINKSIQITANKVTNLNVSFLVDGTYLIRISDEGGNKAYGHFVKH
ncbi:MAG: DUF2271 domain-containing protein [Bacteroidota bacterium]|nr:DUF2271 domain-containing protein [Bacteroidota bacterium]